MVRLQVFFEGRVCSGIQKGGLPDMTRRITLSIPEPAISKTKNSHLRASRSFADSEPPLGPKGGHHGSAGGGHLGVGGQ